MAKAKAKKATKKPGKESPKPVKQPKLPPVFPTLKPNKMTERKLKGMRDKNGDVRFLLNWHFSDAMRGRSEQDDSPREMLIKAVQETVCPTDEWEVYDTEFKLFGALAKQGLITLLVRTKVERAPQTDTNAAAKVEETPPDATGAGPSAGTSRAFDPNPTDAPDTGGLPRIKATVSTDDATYDKVAFDATMWFETATDEELRQLARDGWQHERSSDVIAEFMADHDPDVKTVMTYVDSIQDSPAKKDVNGFSVEVDKDLALTWIGNHRAHLADDIAKIESGEEEPADEDAGKKTA